MEAGGWVSQIAVSNKTPGNILPLQCICLIFQGFHLLSYRVHVSCRSVLSISPGPWQWKKRKQDLCCLLFWARATYLFRDNSLTDPLLHLQHSLDSPCSFSFLETAHLASGWQALKIPLAGRRRLFSLFTLPLPKASSNRRNNQIQDKRQNP